MCWAQRLRTPAPALACRRLPFCTLQGAESRQPYSMIHHLIHSPQRPTHMCLRPSTPHEVAVGPQLEPRPCAAPLGIFPHPSTRPRLAAAPWGPASTPHSPTTRRLLKWQAERWMSPSESGNQCPLAPSSSHPFSLLFKSTFAYIILSCNMVTLVPDARVRGNSVQHHQLPSLPVKTDFHELWQMCIDIFFNWVNAHMS